MMSVSRSHNLAAFSILCANDVNSLLLLPSKILLSLMLTVAMPVSLALRFDFANFLLYLNYLDFVWLTGLLHVLGVFLTVWGELCWLVAWW